MSKAYIAGVGMIPFLKPGKSETYEKMAETAIRAALADAGIDYAQIEEAAVGYTMGDSCNGQEALYRLGLTGIPVVNVENACASGSSAVYLMRRAVESGDADIAIAVGFEQMPMGSPKNSFADRPMFTKIKEATRAIQGWDEDTAIPLQVFGGSYLELQKQYGYSDALFALLSVKSRAHAQHNPYALFREPTTVEAVLASKPIWGPLTLFQCSPSTCGAAAAVLVSERAKRRLGLNRAVLIAGQALATDTDESFASGSMSDVVGAKVSARAASRAFAQAGIGPEDLDVVELHDCFTPNEIVSYSALGLVKPGEAEAFIRDGQNTYGGRVVVNPSGGLLSKGHPIGATGIAQMCELVWQLRGDAQQRQVEGARVGLQHNVGLGGASVVTVLRK
ncbi:MAG: Lipid-transfer protein [Hydrocarboniphaga sp.]|uniref:thiolase C-terminal domain-containing protein n=1 Tax=Hydrocarboniphaga sp. TaxID=2033016 RepID=UPI0026117AEC|nr:beta-ketoacyl synthase N-terminal-like domain-containing protein [Hydrocarboniphaga sp.]MDB5972444.1 Lipid-transfer protein [Hydrocarboniphaga sp.]